MLSTEETYQAQLAATEPRLTYGRAARGDVAQWQELLRDAVAELLHIPDRTEAVGEADILGSEALDGYTRIRLDIRAPDDAAIPAFLLVPHGLHRPVPAVLALHGHGPGKAIPVGIAESEEARRLIEEGERDYAVQAVRSGYIALAPDLRGFGEMMLAEDIEAGRKNSCKMLACRISQMGGSLLGTRVGDISACINYLESRSDVDLDRICSLGQSGGGTATLFAAAVEPRICAAIVSCYFCTFAASIMSVHHCPCNFVPGLQLVAEMHDIAGLITPRPLLIVAGQDDGIFPLRGVREAYAKLERIYQDAGAAAHLELYIGEGGHRFYSARAWDWLAENLA